jgi:hypothetical protein
MSAYSMPLCTIFTKVAGTVVPMCVQHGSPFDVRGDRLQHGPRVAQASRGRRA